ncbi:MAG: hypothetical protein ACNA8W_11425, partial [Bradymonadaceae bacterium]
NLWKGGVPAIVDRSLGPDLMAGHGSQDPAVPAFTRTFRTLDGAVSAGGFSAGGIYRDPHPLPDGSLLVAWAPGPLDLSDPGGRPRFRVLHITLREASAGCVSTDCLPQIDRRTTWIDDGRGGTSVYAPRPLVVRALLPVGEIVLDATRPMVFSVNDAAVNQAILENLSPAGSRTPREVAGVRLVEALPDVRRSGLGAHMPARILGEFDLYADGSAYVKIPAQTPFRVQLLDEEGMAIGEQHNRWLFGWPGQHFPESIDRHQYNGRCGGCHGSLSGLPEDVFPSMADVISTATATLARFDDRNPRLPRRPLELGDDTRWSVDFESDVQPILNVRCGSCHGEDDPAGGLAISYEALLAGGEGSGGGFAYVDAAFTSARSSYLIEVVLGRELDAPRELEGHPTVTLGAGELETLVRWIETGAHFRLREDR